MKYFKAHLQSVGAVSRLLMLIRYQATMTTTLEETRSALEELESIEAGIAERLQYNPDIHHSQNDHGVLGGGKRTIGQTLLQQHEVKLFLDEYSKQCDAVKKNLETFSSDFESFDDKELNFNKFDGLLSNIKDYYAKYPEAPQDSSNIFAMYGIGVDDGKRRKILSSFASNLKLTGIFTVQEKNGKLLDLTSFYNAFINVPGVDSLDYLTYLKKITSFGGLATGVRQSKEYYEYLKELNEYLAKFWTKIQPLSRPERSLDKIKEDFKTRVTSVAVNNEDGSVYCKVCDKTFAKESVFQGHISGKKHIKSAKLAEPRQYMEYQLDNILQLLSKQLKDTRENVERRQLLTVREQQLEKLDVTNASDDEYEVIGKDSEGNDGGEHSGDRVYNPLNIPLGPDGNPLPFWLYKLIGLDTEFNCEVCGNVKYKGRASFEAHFLERKSHLKGLQLLGIESSQIDVFKDISLIKDVLELKAKISKKKKVDETLKEDNYELEDEDGNVMSEKIYNELKKQGLI
ncbi:unnamed protein product [Kuraishia capsulata CBS 1993]|uniref:C2H2-type domain-containing protein n=1 Tax=Kuraishia capsulata CBS 1993 TaxID=1382522 RepID=W6MTM8_9ASCO|nr:uncharacterized protein KUCA_T00004535001 [Kuraishia capsulata CBS 1993]CDK28552.1 unnamed protein product [Kuraishia capsulata CBS 1993]